MVRSNSEHSAATTEALSLPTSKEVEFLQEQVEFLCERVDSLQQLVEQLNFELLDKQQQIQVLEQELAQTNRELCNALAPQQRETGKPQQIRWKEESASKSLDEPIEASYDRPSIEFQFVCLQANFRLVREQVNGIVTQLQQPEDEELTVDFLKKYSGKYQESLNQLEAERNKFKELLKESKDCLKQTKLELAKLSDSNKNFTKSRFCLAETRFQNRT